MPQWAGSCWYYLRYIDASNEEQFVDSVGGSLLDGEGERQGRGASICNVGGTEHAVLHLLYARFWHKVLFDLGQVSTPEPFHRLVESRDYIGGGQPKDVQESRKYCQS